jgi:hypothetical protein
MCAAPTKAISSAAGIAAPALGPLFFAAVGPAARTEGAADVLARVVWPGLGAAFDFEAVGATDADLVGVTEARVVGFALEDWRGVEDGLLETGGWPDPTTTVPVMFGWIEQ